MALMINIISMVTLKLYPLEFFKIMYIVKSMDATAIQIRIALNDSGKLCSVCSTMLLETFNA